MVNTAASLRSTTDTGRERRGESTSSVRVSRGFQAVPLCGARPRLARSWQKREGPSIAHGDDGPLGSAALFGQSGSDKVECAAPAADHRDRTEDRQPHLGRAGLRHGDREVVERDVARIKLFKEAQAQNVVIGVECDVDLGRAVAYADDLDGQSGDLDVRAPAPAVMFRRTRRTGSCGSCSTGRWGATNG